VKVAKKLLVRWWRSLTGTHSVSYEYGYNPNINRAVGTMRCTCAKFVIITMPERFGSPAKEHDKLKALLKWEGLDHMTFWHSPRSSVWYLPHLILLLCTPAIVYVLYRVFSA
jgi:hypothetical protein